MQVVESNDIGKSDIKDLWIILFLVKWNKIFIDCLLVDEWLLLCEFNVCYDWFECDSMWCKNCIYKLLLLVFLDFSFKIDWFFESCVV